MPDSITLTGQPGDQFEVTFTGSQILSVRRVQTFPAASKTEGKVSNMEARQVRQEDVPNDYGVTRMVTIEGYDSVPVRFINNRNKEDINFRQTTPDDKPILVDHVIVSGIGRIDIALALKIMHCPGYPMIPRFQAGHLQISTDEATIIAALEDIHFSPASGHSDPHSKEYPLGTMGHDHRAAQAVLSAIRQNMIPTLGEITTLKLRQDIDQAIITDLQAKLAAETKAHTETKDKLGQLEAARIAYASEFDNDVDNIHHSIRELKSDNTRNIMALNTTKALLKACGIGS